MAMWNWGDRQELWSFVVDTDSYAGSFERELCAYVIGKVDWDYAASPFDTCAGPYLRMFDKGCEIPLEELSENRVVDPGDDGIHRAPCDLAPTPGSDLEPELQETVRGGSKQRFKHPAYNSVAIFLQRAPTSEELNELIKRTLEFPTLARIQPWDTRPAILGCRLVKETTLIDATLVWTPAT